MTYKLSSISMMVVLALFGPAPVHAYLGPGGVISGMGSFLALIAAVLVAIIGFLWFPIKRLIKRGRGVQQTADDTQKAGSSGQDT